MRCISLSTYTKTDHITKHSREVNSSTLNFCCYYYFFFLIYNHFAFLFVSLEMKFEFAIKTHLGKEENFIRTTLVKTALSKYFVLNPEDGQNAEQLIFQNKKKEVLKSPLFLNNSPQIKVINLIDEMRLHFQLQY